MTDVLGAAGDLTVSRRPDGLIALNWQTLPFLTLTPSQWADLCSVARKAGR